MNDRRHWQRVRIVGGPWPERVGCLASIVEPTPEQAAVYPFAGRSSGEVILLLDYDPVAGAYGFFNRRGWTCAMSRRDVETIEREEVNP